MTRTSAGELQPRPIPLNYQVRHEFFSFFLPHFPGALRSERPLLPRRAGALWEGPVAFGRNRESRSREAAGRRNWPEAVPRKLRGRKRSLTVLSEVRNEEQTRVSYQCGRTMKTSRIAREKGELWDERRLT